MKVHIEIDCTLEEARSFLGLPDLRPMQAAVMAKVEQQMLDAVSNLTPTVMRAWLPWIQFPGISPDTEEKAARANGRERRSDERKGFSAPCRRGWVRMSGGCASSSRTEHKRLRLSQACAADAAVKVDQGSREWLSLFHT
ncbi:MAG: hypothetical protein JO110_01565 [Acetobacteraceae bacterium]|nr:hypothetical protein [Acetobacteraceae bacterium]